MKHLSWQLLIACMLISLIVKAQQATYNYRGRVLEKVSGTPLPGATISGNNKKVLAATDSLGYYYISSRLEPGPVEISYMGFQPLFIDSLMPYMELALVPIANTLNGVEVITGYEKLPKERATGSFEIVDNKLVNRTVTTSILDRLEGVTNGLYVSKGSGRNELVIRGISTFSSGLTNPLIIVDNFPFEGSPDALNPNDVEQVTVLKDAAATSVWGARAGNGVIVITTKKGKMNSPLQVQATANLSWQQAPDLAGLGMMDVESYLENEEFLFSRNFYNAMLTNNTNRPLLSPYVEDLAAHRSGNIPAQELQNRRAAYGTQSLLGQAGKYLYQPALRQQYHLALSGGSKLVSFQAGLGYDENRSNTIGDRYGRITLNTQLGIQVAAKTRVELSVNQTFARTQNNSLNGLSGLQPGSSRNLYYPYAMLADEQGRPLALGREYRQAYLDTTGRGLLADWSYAPLADRLMQHTNRQQLQSWYRLSINQQLGANVSLQGIYQYQFEMADNETEYGAGSWYVRNQVNLYSQRTGNGVNRPIPQGGIFDRQNSRSHTHSGRLQVNYNGSRGRFAWNSLAGAEIRQTVQQGFGDRLYGYNGDVLSSAQIDHVTLFPTWGNLRGNQQILSIQSLSATDNRFVSAFANAAFTMDGKYLLSASVRKDASNILGVNSNQKGVPLWSAGLAWQLHREDWFTRDLFSQFKLRTTYGTSGNVNPSLSALSTIRYLSANSNINNVPGAQIVNPPNPNLRWEKVKMWNIGLDFELAQTKFGGSMEWYSKNCEDLLAPVALDITSGYSTLTLNSGVLKGWGLDVQLHYTLEAGKFVWFQNLSFSHVTNRVEEYYYSSNVLTNVAGTGSTITPRQGYPTYAVFSYRWAGLDPANGDPQGYINNEISKNYNTLVRPATMEDFVFHGPARPTWFGFWRHSFCYKNWSVSPNIGGEFGHFFRRRSINYNALYNNWSGHPDFNTRWMKPGDESNTEVPSRPYPVNNNRDLFYTNSEVLVESAAHIRLHDLRIAWQTSLKGKHGAPANLELYGYFYNLGTLWTANGHGLDPVYQNQPLPAPALSFGLKAGL